MRSCQNSIRKLDRQKDAIIAAVRTDLQELKSDLLDAIHGRNGKS